LIAVDLVVKCRQVLVGGVTIGLLVQLLAHGGREGSGSNEVARFGSAGSRSLAGAVEAEVGEELPLVIKSLDRVHGDGPLPQTWVVIVVKGKQVHSRRRRWVVGECW